MVLTVRSGAGDYPVHFREGGLAEVSSLFDLARRVLIVTDTGVPAEYADRLAAQCGLPVIERIEAGEGSKCVGCWSRLLSRMLREGFTRGDAAVALGGGVVGDLTGFAAACYMRGIDFYNVPTTVLSQVDSSVGGKTAVDLDGVKNAVGAFYPPKGVLIDTALLSSLPKRQIANGLAEAVKMALTLDGELFEKMERGQPQHFLPEIIRRSVELKKAVVEADEHEGGLRRVLNFGHTLGHGIESASPSLFHGECVGLGMLPMCSARIRKRLENVLDRLGLPTFCHADAQRVFAAIAHDKKAGDDGIRAILAEEVGTYREETLTLSALRERYDACFGGKERS